MFTGIIQTIGKISGIEKPGGDLRISIELVEFDVSGISRGDSICVNGVCVTVVKLSAGVVTFDISNETLSCTSFASLKTGAGVNVELAMQISDRFDGHIVSGHVDTVGALLSIKEDARSKRYEFEIPDRYSKYICPKGSICIDGVSLTVNDVQSNKFSVNIIPHTLQHTIFSEYSSGTKVNIEVDIISRYLERLIQER
ncbi:MAG: riboflavin synthase [Gammaproteobacteria bacterium]|nr:riboflavin synthase [Gammaproteobacteria bacterium]